MLNQIVLMGRLTRDPELRTTTNGNSVASFTLAVDNDYKPQDGDRQTDFIDVVAWKHTADFVAKYLAKGRMVVVSGRLQIRNWEDDKGQKRKSAEVVAGNIYFADSKKNENANRGQVENNADLDNEQLLPGESADDLPF